MATPGGSSGKDREELEKRLQHMKKKYARIQNKLQKSVKQKKVKEHVKKKLAELQLNEGDASPVNTSREEFKDIQKGASLSSGSFPIGPLQLDDSISESITNRDERVKLNRKSASSGRLKKRRSVSFDLNKDDVVSKKTLDEGEDGNDSEKETPTTRDDNNKDVSSSDDVKSSVTSISKSHQEDNTMTRSRDKHKSGTTKVQSKDEGNLCDIPVLPESQNVAEDLPDDIMCVEETQDLSQLVAPKRLFKQSKKFDAIPSTSKEQIDSSRKLDRFKGQTQSDKSTNEKLKDISVGSTKPTDTVSEDTKPTSTKTVLAEHNVFTFSNDLPNFSDLSTPRLGIPDINTFSDPGPRTSRSGRRRARRSREFTSSDISMKDVIQNSQSSQEGNHTWIEGLVYPVEYYVRKTRSMSGKSSPAIYSENVLASVVNGTDYVDKGMASVRSRKRRQKCAALQHKDAASQSDVGISSEDASIKNSMDLNVSGNKVPNASSTKSVIKSLPSESEEVQLAEGDVGMELSESKSQISTRNSNELVHSGDCEESVEETQLESERNTNKESSLNLRQLVHLDNLSKSIGKAQLESESNTNSMSSQSSNNSTSSGRSNSTSSGRRNLSLSRRKRGLAKKTGNSVVKQGIMKQDQISSDKTVKTSQSSEQINQEKLCVEIKKTEEAVEDLRSQVGCDKILILPKLTSEVKTKILSQTVDFALPDNEFVEMKLSKTESSTIPESKFSSQCGDKSVSYMKREVSKSCNTKNLSDQDKDTSNTPLCSIDKVTKHMSIELEEDTLSSTKKLIDFATPASVPNVPLPKSKTSQENSHIQTKYDFKLSSDKKPLKSSSQHSQGVLESQFSQTQCVPDGTPVFPHMGCSPGSSPTSEVVIRPTLVLSPTSASEQGTMSFSPHQCSPTSVSQFEDGSPELCISQNRGEHFLVDQSQHSKVTNKEITTSDGTSEKEDAQDNSPPSLQDDSPLDRVYTSPNGVVTPPMTAGNINHTSPFADVATATPYGKAEIPRCQSQCDPEDEEEEEMAGVGHVAEMPGFRIAGCLKHDFDNFPSPIIGMYSCNVTYDNTEDLCLVVYSVDLVVLWMARNQQDWQVQASWTVSEQEEIACIMLVPCSEESSISIVIGGNFNQCCARVLRYNINTGDQHQLDLAPLPYSESFVFHDLCLVSHDTYLIQGRENLGGYVVYRFNISEDFSKVASSLMHTSENDSISMLGVEG
ncbi:uncharacterized protein, partial [Amphiura filiformis]|uniref:uncharacterized protein n=1 Tax=Amphiura filiformis TaxID=82378 RepID=UPI003B2198A1